MALVCDKCGATIPEGARFCPRCADPVTAADTVNGRVAVSRASSRGYYLGPRGGCYTYSASGRKRYVDHSYCY
jgi:predicted amidophosphoribosyltransferase